MKFELSLLDAIIYEKKQITPTGISQVLADEKERITAAMRQAVIKRPTPSVKKYVQQHQLTLIELVNYAARNQNKNIIRQSAKIAEELLEFLEKQFPDWISLDSYLPEKVCSEWPLLAASQLNTINELAERSNVPEEFTRAIRNAMDLSVKQAMDNRLSFRMAYQVKELFHGVKEVLELNTEMPERLPRQLLLQFCRVNLNSLDGYIACTEALKEDFEQKKVTSEQLIHLRKQLRFLRYAIPLKGLFFTSASRSLSKLLTDWVLGEIHRLQNNELDIDGEQDEEIIKDSEKIMTSLSRAELALLVVLFFKAGVFTNPFKSSVARFMGLFVRTRNKSKEDKQSSRKIYDDMKSIKISTVDSVDLIIERMSKQNQKIRQEITGKRKMVR